MWPCFLWFLVSLNRRSYYKFLLTYLPSTLWVSQFNVFLRAVDCFFFWIFEGNSFDLYFAKQESKIGHFFGSLIFLREVWNIQKARYGQGFGYPCKQSGLWNHYCLTVPNSFLRSVQTIFRSKWLPFLIFSFTSNLKFYIWQNYSSWVIAQDALKRSDSQIPESPIT